MVNECRDVDRLDPLIQKKVKQLQDICKSRGLALGIGETFRSVERQNYLYEQGRTRPGAIVTYAKGEAKESYHQWGLAVDFFQNIKGKEYDAYFMNTIGEIAESIGFDWGGNWLMKDTPHLQMTFGLTIKDLNAGKSVEEAKMYQDMVKQVANDIQYIEAVNKLNRKSVISDTELWLNPSKVQEKHIKSTIIKMATMI